MDLNDYLKNHIIVSIGKIVSENYLMVETIVDNPIELVNIALKHGYYITEIRWWDRNSILNDSQIGYGGTLDPRNPNYYFAETDIFMEFNDKTTLKEYIYYLEKTKNQYFSYDIYPAFDIILKCDL